MPEYLSQDGNNLYLWLLDDIVIPEDNVDDLEFDLNELL